MKYLTCEINCGIIFLCADCDGRIHDRGEKREKRITAKEKDYGMLIIEVWGKQQADTAFSARRKPTGGCGLISVGVKHVFSRKNSNITGGVQ